jgi:hypothetical protein
MIKRITDIFNNLYHSFFNNDKGFSARKLTAFAAFWTAFELAQSLDGENRLYAVYAFLGVGLLCLGIVTMQNIISFKNGNNSSEQQPD